MIIETEILQKGEMADHNRIEDGAGKRGSAWWTHEICEQMPEVKNEQGAWRPLWITDKIKIWSKNLHACLQTCLFGGWQTVGFCKLRIVCAKNAYL